MQLLRHMQQLLGDKAGSTDSSFVREFFLQCLPAKVRMVLTSTPDTTSLEDLAQLADKIVEVAIPSIAAVHTVPHLNAEVEQLQTEITRLQEIVKSLSFRGRSPRHRSPSPCPSSDNTLCWYHQHFGDEARQCQLPCTKSGNGKARC